MTTDSNVKSFSSSSFSFLLFFFFSFLFPTDLSCASTTLCFLLFFFFLAMRISVPEKGSEVDEGAVDSALEAQHA